MTALTKSEIISIAGHIDEGRVLQILKTGATLEELREAVTWANADDAMSKTRHHALAGRIETLCEILQRPDSAIDDQSRRPD